MNFWCIKHNGARVRDDFVAKNNKLEVSSGYSINIDY